MAGSSLTWNLVANANGYVAGMAKGQAATKKFTSELQRTAEQSGRTRAALKGAAAGLAAVGIVKFAKDSVTAYAQAEASQAKLTLAYQKFPKTANVSIEVLRSYNSELQRKTKFDDDDTAAMQAHLAMFNLTGQQIKTLTPLVQDLASAQGIDLASASDLVGKAMMGNARGLKAIGINFKATGDAAKDYAAIQAALNEKVGGFAENEGKTAAGQAAILRNQFGDLQETVGGALVPALTTLVGVVTPVVEGFNSLSDPMKTTIVAAASLATGFVFLAPKIDTAVEVAARWLATSKEAAAGSSLFGRAVRGAGSLLAGPWGLAAAAGVGILAAFASNTDDATTKTNDFTDALRQSNGAIDDNVRQLAAKKADELGLLRIADDLGISYNTVIDAIIGNAKAMNDLRAATAPATDELGNFANVVSGTSLFGGTLNKTTGETTAQMQSLAAGVSDLNGQMSTAATDAARVGRASGVMATGLDAGASSAAGASEEIQTLKDKIDELRGTYMTAEEATSNLEDAIDKASEAAKENGKALSLNSAAGRDNREALRRLADAALDGVDAWSKNGASADTIKTKTDAARASFIATAVKMGATKTEAEALADAYGLIPTKIATTVTADTADAKAKADAVKAHWMATVAFIAAHPAKYNAYLGSKDGGPVPGFAGGGHVRGPGSSRSDSIPAMLSNGEYVINARSAAANRGLLDAINYGSPISVSGMAGGSGSFTATAPLMVTLDGVTPIWQGLLRLKRGRGGIELGIS